MAFLAKQASVRGASQIELADAVQADFRGEMAPPLLATG